MSSARRSPALPWAVVAAALSFVICYAVFASGTRTAPRRAASAHPMREVARMSLTLHAVPALRVRAAILQQAPASARPNLTPAAAPARPQQPPAPAVSAPVAPSTAPVSTIAPPVPPSPAPKARPKLVASPKRAPPVSFDQAGPQSQPAGFDNSG
jgi:hypothetical protein